jgi:hypothetical protein
MRGKWGFSSNGWKEMDYMENPDRIFIQVAPFGEPFGTFRPTPLGLG